MYFYYLKPIQSISRSNISSDINMENDIIIPDTVLKNHGRAEEKKI